MAGKRAGSVEAFLPLLTAAQMRRTDAAAIRGLGIPGAVLMERAGQAVADYLLESFPADSRFVVLAGKGNNGGDGFVAARHLLTAGAEARVFAVAAAGEYRGDALVNLKILGKLGLKVVHRPAAAALKRALAAECVIVDAIFGTGFAGEPRGPAAEFIAAARTAAIRYQSPVVAVDIASGVDATTGEAAANSLPATATVTFHLPKVGHYVAPGGFLCGDLMLADIGIPESVSAAANHFLCDDEAVASFIPPKTAQDNKFSAGHVLVAGGSTGLTGAACLAAEAALRGGAGVVQAAVPASLNPVFEQKLLEVMTVPLPDNGGSLAEDGLKPLLAASARVDAVVLGPGLGRDESAARLARGFLAAARQPVVLDADGLGALAGRIGSLKKRPAATVLTPHEGELARLLGADAADVKARRLHFARAAARKSGAVVLLKGADTIITDGSAVIVNDSGNPGLATAGAGDVLAGVIASMLSRGLGPLEAAAAGALLQGRAAELAAGDLSVDNLISSDLLDYLPLAFASLEAGEETD